MSREIKMISDVSSIEISEREEYKGHNPSTYRSITITDDYGKRYIFNLHANGCDDDTLRVKKRIAVTGAELLSQSNEILTDAVFKEGNLPTGKRVVIRTGLPTYSNRQSR